MMWLLGIIIVAVIGGIAVVASGVGDPLAQEYDDRPDANVPLEGPLSGADLKRVRFSTAFRGYRASEVDALLDRLADQVGGGQVGGGQVGGGQVGGGQVDRGQAEQSPPPQHRQPDRQPEQAVRQPPARPPARPAARPGVPSLPKPPDVESGDAGTLG